MSATPPSDQQTCPTCGAQNEPGSRFCLNCGGKLEGTAPRGSAMLPTPPAGAATSYPARQDAPPSPYEYAPPAPVAQPSPYNQPPVQPPYQQAPPQAYGAPQPTAWPVQAQQPRRIILPFVLTGVIIAVVACTLLALGAAFALGGKNIALFTPATATPLEADQILVHAADRMAAVKTVHYKMLGQFTNVGNQGDFTINLNGDIRFPDSYSMHREGSGDIIVIGPDAWVRDPNAQRWIKGPSSQVASPTTNPAALARFVRYNRLAVVESDYMSDTQHLYRLSFTIDTLALASGEGQGSAGEALLGTDSDADAVVSADDYLLHELVLRITSGENSGAQIRIEFSNFDQPVAIDPPEQ